MYDVGIGKKVNLYENCVSRYGMKQKSQMIEENKRRFVY